MPRNVYFSQGNTPEKRLHEDIVIEALKIYGHDVYYIPRKIVNTNAIFNEDALSEFGEAFLIEMYLANVDGFEGDGNLLSRFGVEVRDQAELIISTRRWEELVGRFQSIPEVRPQEGDLIYFPLTNGLFEIKFVEDEDPFYQLSGLTTFKLSVETFEYGNEALDTGIEAIDSFETQYATQTTLTLGAGAGAFVVGEDVSQTIGSVTVTGEVSSIDENFESGTKKINISSQKASDASNTLFTVTAGSAGNIIGTKNSPVANYEITSIDGFNSLDDNDPYADNSDFETIGNNFIDFTESNPFGDVNITS